MIACTANLKQIGVAANAYCQDNGDYFFGYRKSFNSSDAGYAEYWCTARGQLVPYITGQDAKDSNGAGTAMASIMKCSSKQQKPTILGDRGTWSYITNAYVIRRSAVDNTLNSYGHPKITQVHTASQRMLIGEYASGEHADADGQYEGLQTSKLNALSKRHSGSLNLLYIDCHVASVRWESVISTTNAAYIRAGLLMTRKSASAQYDSETSIY